MNELKNIPIAVSSRSFPKSEELKNELRRHFSSIKFNETNRNLESQELIEFLKGAVGAIVGLDKVTDEVLSELPGLKVISKYGVGMDNLDLTAMKHHGVKLGWTGGVNARSVSELTLSFILGLLRQVFTNSRKLSQGLWQGTGGIQLSGKTVGIIGCGYVGKDLVALLQPFNCHILIHDILDLSEFCETTSAKYKLRQVSKDELLAASDVVSLHVPYDPKTHHLIGARELSLMKPTAILINTSRGSVVDEKALCESLKQKQIAGAAADVFSKEPVGDCDLVRLENFVGTPHIGGNSVEAVRAMGAAAIENLVKLLRESS
jgi:phosphoglycerate dehydrogenase-like enzyme